MPNFLLRQSWPSRQITHEGWITSHWFALWTVANSFALVLSGESDRYGQWWSETISAVSRPDSLFRPAVPALVQVGERIAVCGIAASARVIAPDRTEVALAIDPAADAPERRGDSWPYFFAWLLVCATLWFAERRVRAMHMP